jgi:hypothetical protein
MKNTGVELASARGLRVLAVRHQMVLFVQLTYLRASERRFSQLRLGLGVT